MYASNSDSDSGRSSRMKRRILILIMATALPAACSKVQPYGPYLYAPAGLTHRQVELANQYCAKRHGKMVPEGEQADGLVFLCDTPPDPQALKRAEVAKEKAEACEAARFIIEYSKKGDAGKDVVEARQEVKHCK
jgi:putative hemolysin